MVIEELVKTVLTELKAITKTETVVGKPIQVGEMTIVPVSRISVGFGAGGGKKDAKAGGGEATGGGVLIEPIAFFVAGKDKVELVTIRKEETGWGHVIDLVPQILDKVKNMKSQKDSKSSDSQPKKKKNRG